MKTKTIILLLFLISLPLGVYSLRLKFLPETTLFQTYLLFNK